MNKSCEENEVFEILELVSCIGLMGPEIAINVGKPTSQLINKLDGSIHSWEEHDAESDGGCPSKLLLICLDLIQDDLRHNNEEWDRDFVGNPWGFEFWSYHTSGKDVLEMDGSDSKTEKIAWIASTAADAILTKDRDNVPLNGPFLLYLVPSPHQCHNVLKVCKPLMKGGISVCSSIDHLIHSLKRSEPEILISTPEKLLELLLLRAIDMADLALMVIDGLEAPFEDSYLDAVKSLQRFISGNPQIFVFCDRKKQ